MTSPIANEPPERVGWFSKTHGRRSLTRTTSDLVTRRHAIRQSGPVDGQPMMFAHGFGCDQAMWRFVAPAFEETYRVILFDHLGAGNSDLDAYSAERHSSLAGYAGDVVEICRGLDLEDVIFVGHSVSAMIGVLAALEAPELFDRLVLVGPSPRYIDDGDYVGGFSKTDVDSLLDSLQSNYLGWSAAMAPVIMGNEERPELGQELTNSFCRTDPEIAERFARVTFLSDNREDLARLSHPCLILQCADDPIAPTPVGRFVHEKLQNSTLVQMSATGHCPNLSAPQETIERIASWLDG